MYRILRYHDISCGHTVYEHGGKCANLHGHNYRIRFICECDKNRLDSIGRVIDFSAIKNRLCMWLEDNWDHKFLVYRDDHRANTLKQLDPKGVVIVDFNPTAENMAEYLVNHIGPAVMAGTGVTLVQCDVEETRKCEASYRLK